ncbi:hypothetical protein MKEN_01274200 [Mycena kentingensis (nom. inval.)]|nr:hypothetical protein MKEN_01274200 [Mycena kentingensis (nom. inval.)]
MDAPTSTRPAIVQSIMNAADDEGHGGTGSDSRLPLFTKVNDIVGKNANDLAARLDDYLNLPLEQRNHYSSRLKSLVDGKATIKTLAFTGKSVCPGSVGLTVPKHACTASVIEVHYHQLSDYKLVVHFIGQEQWREEVERLLLVITDGDSQASKKSAEDRLFTIYPHAKKMAPAELTAEHLLDVNNSSDESDGRICAVAKKLGTRHEMNVSDLLVLHEELARYLSASSHDESLWPIVAKAEIHGDFDILEPGYMFVDLPGHGDDDDIRSKMAQQYLKDSDGVVLVVDCVRALTDPDVSAYLEKTVIQQLRDGRRPNSDLIIIATKADTTVLPSEVRLDAASQARVDEITKIITPQRPERKKRRLDAESFTASPNTAGHAKLAKEKQHILVKARNDLVQRGLAERCAQLRAQITDAEPDLVFQVFCVASHDFLALLDEREPSVFTRAEETQFIALYKFLRLHGERRVLKESQTRLLELMAVVHGMEKLFSEEKSTAGTTSKDRALELVAGLQKETSDDVRATFDRIKTQFNATMACIRGAVETAKADCIDCLQKFDSGKRWQTYRATMKRDGQFMAHDLNRDLTRSILSSITPGWTRVMVHRTPKELADLKKRIHDKTLLGVPAILAALQGRVVDPACVAPRDSPLKSAFQVGNMLENPFKRINRTLRDGQRNMTRSLDSVVRAGLRMQYSAAASESGAGCLLRMKESNATFLESSRSAVFDPIRTQFEDALEKTLTQMRQQAESVVCEIEKRLRLTLIEDAAKANDEHDKKARREIMVFIGDLIPRMETLERDVRETREGLE